MIAYKFNFKALGDLENDFKASERAIPAIAAAVMREKFRDARSSLLPGIPRSQGALVKSFGFSVRKTKGMVTGRLGFMINRRVSPATIIAGNVLQKGSATPRKGKFLWIPLGSNRKADGSAGTSPRTLISAGGFVKQSKSGNIVAFARAGLNIMPMFVLKRRVSLGTPLPLERAGERAAEEIAAQIPEVIEQVIVAKRKIEAGV